MRNSEVYNEDRKSMMSFSAGGAFAFEAALDTMVEQVVQEAFCKERMAVALRQSRKDFEKGFFYSSRENLLVAVAKKREAAHV